MKSSIKSSQTAQLMAIAALLVALVAGAFGAMSLPHLQTEYSVTQFLPTHHPAITMDRHVRNEFHLWQRAAFIGLLTLDPQSKGDWLRPDRVTQLNRLTQAIGKWTEVDQTL